MKVGAGVWLLAWVGCGDQEMGPPPDPGPPALAFGAGTVVFPDTIIDHVAVAARSVLVTNVSADPITPTFALKSSVDFVIESDTCDVLPPAASCAVIVRFRPHTLGARSVELVGAADGRLVTTTLAGVALPEPGLHSTPTPALDYADVAVGTTKKLQVTLLNESAVMGRPYSLALAGADAADFSITADACSGVPQFPNGACTVDVAFAPQATSPRSAQLVVSSGNLGTLKVGLVGTGIRPAALAVTPDTGMFGSVFVLGQSPAQSFTVTNTGTVPTAALAVRISGPDANAFALTDGCSGSPLAAGSSCMFSIVYFAGTTGMHEATALVFDSSGVSVDVPLTGTGEPPELQITPSAWDFGNIFMGQTSDVKTFTVQNTGSSRTGPLEATPLTISSSVVIVDDACTGVDLAPAATCTVGVKVTPAFRGASGGALQIRATRGDTARAPVQFHGVIVATLIATPGAAAFGDVQLTENPHQVITVENGGDLDTGPIVVTVAGDDAADVSLVEDCSGRSLPLLFRCSLTVSFSPSHLGAETARIEITSPGATLTIPVDANVLPAPMFTVSPDAVVVNPAAVGEPSAVTFVVQGTAATATGPLTVQLTGPQAADYATTGDDCSGQTLASGQACTITLTVTPSATGSRNATLVVSGVPGGYRKVPLTAIAFTQAALTISPPAITFAATGVGQIDEFGFVSIKNTGQLPTGALTAQLVGQDPGEFLVAIDTCTGVVLGANAECSVLTHFAPTRIATSTATVVVSAAPGGTVTAQLTGTGLPPPVISSSVTSFDFAPQETFTGIGGLIRIDNVGGSPTDQLHATLTGPQADQFTADDYFCFRVDVGSACEVPISFEPTQVGQASATLVVGSALAGSVTIALTGTATAGAKVVVAPETFDFGFVPAGEQSPVRSFIATNIGQRDITKFHTYAAGPPGCEGFSVVATTCGTTLGPGASCRDDVVFHPLSPPTGACRLVFIEDTLVKGEAELLGQSSF